MESPKQSIWYLEYLVDFLFSLNIALVAKWQDGQRPVNLLTGLLGFHELQTKSAVNAFFHLQPHSDVGGYTAVLAVVLFWALSIFVLLRVASFSRVIRSLLRSIGGLISLAAIPVAWLLLPPTSRIGLADPSHAALTLELLAVGVMACLYMWRKLPMTIWLTTGLLIFHFALWGWLLFGGVYFWRAPFYLLFPAAGLASCLAWGFYFKNSSASVDVSPATS